MSLHESIIEDDVPLEWFGELGYAIGHESQPAPGEAIPTPDDFFGPAPRFSVASPMNLAPPSPNLAGKRDADDCLIAYAIIESGWKP